MKVGEQTDDLWLVLQHDTALDMRGLEIVERAELLVDDALVRE